MITINLTKSPPALLQGHLKMGGRNPQGCEINANNHYLTLDRNPWLPVMGEFHFSRYPRSSWKEEIRKMKAGGIDIVASYIFWIHHEERESQFDWSGNRSLRAFAETCQECGLYCFPRIGPWVHGETRNGGFPDWIMERCGKAVRQDSPNYLLYVERLYREIAKQLDGLLWKDGGAVIGIQLENELTNSPGHIVTLKKMARSVGLDAPLYTMTGWGPAEAPTDEVIPVFGGYPDAFWDRQVTGWSRNSRKNYFFSTLRDDNTIGTDLLQTTRDFDLSYLERYPYGTCEVGGGMQVAYHRRPQVIANDIAALAIVKIGNGSNLMGYYMYHGGSHPLGSLSSMQESQATGYWNDLPVISYDFQAPLGEYGQVRQSYHELRLLHLFLRDFGSKLALMPLSLPDRLPADLDDRQTLRWAVRSSEQSGFLFINNYQRIEGLPDHTGCQFELNLPGSTLTLPFQPAQIAAGMFGFWPFNLDLDGILLRYATAQPVCRLDGGTAPVYVFTAMHDIPVEFAFAPDALLAVAGPVQQTESSGLTLINELTPGAACKFDLQSVDGKTITILVLEATQARQCWKAILWGQERLILCKDALLFEAEAIELQTCQPEFSIAIFPKPEHPLAVKGSVLPEQSDGIFARFQAEFPQPQVQVSAQQVQSAGPAAPVSIGAAGVAQPPEDDAFDTAEVWRVSIPTAPFAAAHELYLQVDFIGDIGRAYLGETLIADHFYHGRTWEIGLKRFVPQAMQTDLYLKFLPLRKDAPIYLPENAWPDFQGTDEIVRVDKISLAVEQVYHIKMHSP